MYPGAYGEPRWGDNFCALYDMLESWRDLGRPGSLRHYLAHLPDVVPFSWPRGPASACTGRHTRRKSGYQQKQPFQLHFQ